MNAMAREQVEAEARKHGDETVAFAPSADGKHPESYPSIAVEVRKRLGR